MPNRNSLQKPIGGRSLLEFSAAKSFEIYRQIPKRGRSVLTFSGVISMLKNSK